MWSLHKWLNIILSGPDTNGSTYPTGALTTDLRLDWARMSQPPARAQLQRPNPVDEDFIIRLVLGSVFANCLLGLVVFFYGGLDSAEN